MNSRIPYRLIVLALVVCAGVSSGTSAYGQCFGVAVGQSCTYLAMVSDVKMVDADGSPYICSLSGSMTFTMTQLRDDPCGVDMDVVQFSMNGSTQVLGTLTFTVDRTRTPTPTTIGSNDVNFLFPAGMSVSVFLELRLSARPGIVYRSMQQIQFSCYTVKAFCQPHWPDAYPVTSPVDFEDVANPGVVALTLTKGTFVM